MLDVLAKLASIENMIHEIRAQILDDPLTRETVLTKLLYDVDSRTDITPAAWDRFAASQAFTTPVEVSPYEQLQRGVAQFGFSAPANQKLIVGREVPAVKTPESSPPAWNLTIETPAGLTWCQVELLLDWELCFRHRQFILIAWTKSDPPTSVEFHHYYDKKNKEQARGSYSYSFVTGELAPDIHQINFGDIGSRRDEIEPSSLPRIMMSLPQKKAFRYHIASCRLYALK